MAFFLPSSTPTSTTTSLSSSPQPVLRSLDSEDESKQSHDANGSLRHRDTPSGFTMFGLLSRRIEYISGASASDISSLESSESEVESWTRRDDEDEDEDDRHTNTRTSRSTQDARSPNGRTPDIPRDPFAELSVVGTSPSHGTARSITTHHTGVTGPSSEHNVASSSNQIEGGETVKRRRNHRHGSTEVDRRSARRVKLRKRRHVYEAFISRDFLLVITLCFGLACAWMVLARPIMMNWFGNRSGDGYMYMDG